MRLSFRRKPVKPENPAPVVQSIINWMEIDAGHHNGYPVKHSHQWVKYTVSENAYGRWEVKWIMHNMVSVIGWTETLEKGKMLAETHYVKEEANAYRV